MWIIEVCSIAVYCNAKYWPPNLVVPKEKENFKYNKWCYVTSLFNLNIFVEWRWPQPVTEQERGRQGFSTHACSLKQEVLECIVSLHSPSPSPARIYSSLWSYEREGVSFYVETKTVEGIRVVNTHKKFWRCLLGTRTLCLSKITT